jgi:hypothetical protein
VSDVFVVVLCIASAIGIAGALIIWLAIELELSGGRRREWDITKKDKHNGEKS